MVKNLISKKDFAALCGVTQGAVTKFVKGKGAPAVCGSRIDLSHPVAKAYRDEKTAPVAPEPVTGIDPLFEEALAFCRESWRWNPSALGKALRIGHVRAARILEQLRAAGHAPAEPPPAGPSGQAPPPKPPRQTKRTAPPTQTPPHNPGLPEVPDEPDELDELGDWTLREIVGTYGTAPMFLDWLKALKELEAVKERRLKTAAVEEKLVSKELVKVAVLGVIDATHLRMLKDGAATITAGVISKHQAGFNEAETTAYVSDVMGSFIKPMKAKIQRGLEQG